MDETRIEILKANIPKEKKRELLQKLSNNSFTQDDLNFIRTPKPKIASSKNKYSIFSRNTVRVFWWLWFIKYLILLGVFMSLWTTYSHPWGIKVRWFVWAIWQVRVSLDELRDNAPEFYKLVVENTDEINIDYIKIPSNKWWHAFIKDWKRIVRIFRPSDIETPYLSQLLVHEACHWQQWILGRFWNEPQQKLENECHYLGIHIIEDLFPAETQLLDYMYDIATEKTGTWWDGWKSTWDWGDTTEWLSKLLPKSKIQEYRFFGDNYDYSR